MGHRNAIANWVINDTFKIETVLDYGGGFGTLARVIADKDKDILIDVFEPHPSELALSLAAPYKNIRNINEINSTYDCLISIDVLEHIYNPLDVLLEMSSRVKLGGYLVIANNFHPVMKCHLPLTFHLMYSFRFIAHIIGLKRLKRCEGSHAILFQKTEDKPNKIRLLFMEHLSKGLYPVLRSMHSGYNYIRRISS